MSGALSSVVHDDIGSLTAQSAHVLHDKLESARLLGEEINAWAACLPILLTALEEDKNLHAVCDALPYGLSEFRRIDIINTLAEMGYSLTSGKLHLDHMDPRLLPCLFVVDNMPYVILESTPNGWRAFDGQARDMVLIPSEETMSGTGYFSHKRAESDPLHPSGARRAVGMGWFRTLGTRFHNLGAQIALVSVVLNLVGVGMPILVMLTYDRVVGAQAVDNLTYIAAGIVLALGAESILRILRARYIAWVGVRIDTIVSNAIIGRLLRLPASQIENASVASQVARLKGFETIRDFFTGPLFLGLTELPFTLVLAAALAILAGWLALVPVVLVLVYMAVLWIINPRIRVAVHQSARCGAKRQQLTQETFESLPALRYSGMSEVWAERFRKVSGEASHAAFRASYITGILETVSQMLTVVTGVAVLWLGAGMVIEGAVSAGGLVAVMILTWRVLSPLAMFCNALPRLEQLRQTIAQVNNLMNIPPESVRHGEVVKTGSIKGALEFRSVGLRYNKETDPVFSGLSFRVKPGEMVAITGGNGSGKSTILKLINGLYHPQAGNLRLDGVDIRQIDPIELRRHIAYMPQTPDFFVGTLAENLRMANPMAGDAALLSALKHAGALEEIEAMPDGLNTHMGNNAGLSATLAYRLNFARIALSDAPIILCDELPYAVLNSKSGEMFESLLESWRGKRTVLLVTHREDYVRRCDMAVGLRAGEMPLVGKPDQIIQQLKVSLQDATFSSHH